MNSTLDRLKEARVIWAVGLVGSFKYGFGAWLQKQLIGWSIRYWFEDGEDTFLLNTKRPQDHTIYVCHPVRRNDLVQDGDVLIDTTHERWFAFSGNQIKNMGLLGLTNEDRETMWVCAKEVDKQRDAILSAYPGEETKEQHQLSYRKMMALRENPVLPPGSG